MRARAAVTCQVEMEMIVVVAVREWPQHRRERIACPAVNSPQEPAFSCVTRPAVSNRDPAPVSKHELRNIDRVGVAVLGKPAAGHMIDRPAAIGSGDLQRIDGRTEIVSRGRIDDRPHPVLDGRNHGAAQGCRGLQVNTPPRRP